MLPSYPPMPWPVTGFDMMLAYAGVEDPDHERARRVVHALRRASLLRGAKLSAAKCLYELYGFGAAPHGLRRARRLVVEAPCAGTYWLASSERKAGHLPELPEANEEPERVPDYTYLGATLGRVGVATGW
jgi:hypothetical protein